MATPFPRTVQALQATDFRRALVTLSLLIVIVGLWFAWFFLAKITLFDISEPMPVSGDEILVANFPFKTSGRLQRGQTAFVQLTGNTGTAVGPVPALVTEVEERPDIGKVQVTLFVFWALATSVPPQNGLMGQVEIEVEYVSPATLVLRTVKDGLDTYPTQFTPQDRAAIDRQSSCIMSL
ncbi:hypothetical protein NKDENANG_00334 [Candidatus Entotheonellaceae bacterium PAL068K]